MQKLYSFLAYLWRTKKSAPYVKAKIGYFTGQTLSSEFPGAYRRLFISFPLSASNKYSSLVFLAAGLSKYSQLPWKQVVETRSVHIQVSNQESNWKS